MGCGCKNKGNESQQPTVQQVQAAQTQRQQTAESVKSAIKKTVEKYGHPIECSIPPNYSKGYLIKVTDLLQVARGF